MTVLVGYLPEKDGRASLDLAAQIARSGTPEALVVATVVPHPWSTPSMAKVDAEFVAWAQEQGAQALATAREHLTRASPDVEVSFVPTSGRTVAKALLAAAERAGADLLILGSASGGPLGQVMVGATAEPLLHSSPLPVTLAPRGYRVQLTAFSRITCAFSGAEDSVDLLAATAAWSSRLGVPLRVATFGVRGRTVYPSGVGFNAEDGVLAQWRQQSTRAQERALAELTTRGVLPSQVSAVIATGADWSQALEGIDWQSGEVLVIGSSHEGPMARVFLGSRAIKIIRQSPVPVIVVPGAEVAQEVLGLGPPDASPAK